VGQQILALHPRPLLVEVWGSTETGGVATRLSDPGGLWRPFPVVSVSQNDQQHLVIRSPFAPCGPLEAYTTTDRVALEDHGFRHLGRSDGVLKVGGKRVALQDLEACARSHPQVSDVVCIALPTPGLRNQIIAMAVASLDLTVAALRSHLATHFDDVVLPRKIRILARLPRTATGKLPRAEVEALFVLPPSTTLAPLEPPAPCAPVMLSPLEQIQRRLEQAGFLAFEPSTNPVDQANVLQFNVSTHADQLWFQGHFPGAAVLPGVVQLRSLVEHSARLMWPDLGQLTGLSKVKFKRPILPGDRLRVRLTHVAEKRSVQFDIQWLGSSHTISSPLSALLPQVFSQSPPSETSSGILTFTGST
jgi:3-hydroxymyristoyl/3-hydroxydecanoyl-(acyl carrier protein) dehydratase